jgi:hypothetical protein
MNAAGPSEITVAIYKEPYSKKTEIFAGMI